MWARHRPLHVSVTDACPARWPAPRPDPAFVLFLGGLLWSSGLAVVDRADGAGGRRLCGRPLPAVGPGQLGLAGRRPLVSPPGRHAGGLILSKFVIVTVLSLAVGARPGGSPTARAAAEGSLRSRRCRAPAVRRSRAVGPVPPAPLRRGGGDQPPRGRRPPERTDHGRADEAPGPVGAEVGRHRRCGRCGRCGARWPWPLDMRSAHRGRAWPEEEPTVAPPGRQGHRRLGRPRPPFELRGRRPNPGRACPGTPVLGRGLGCLPEGVGGNGGGADRRGLIPDGCLDGTVSPVIRSSSTPVVDAVIGAATRRLEAERERLGRALTASSGSNRLHVLGHDDLGPQLRWVGDRPSDGGSSGHDGEGGGHRGP